MFKQFSFSFFKRITLLTLLSLFVLLMAMNISAPLGNGDKSSFSNIKQIAVVKPSSTVLFSSSAKTPQAVWNFLKSQERFRPYGLKTTDWKNWLDVIQKRQIQQTFKNNFINAVVDLRPLWGVDLTSNYSNLNSQAKQTLTDLSQIVYNSGRVWWKYGAVLRVTVEVFSFYKEKYGAVYDLITTLKNNNRWNNLKKYQIKKINDVNIESLLLIENIESLLANKETYDNFSESVKASFRNLLDLDLASSPFFAAKTYGALSNMFKNKNNYNPILNAFGTRIDNVIKKTEADSTNLWNFLKQSNRLTKLKIYQINMIDDVNLVSLLQNPSSQINYDTLTPAQKLTLSLLVQTSTRIKNDITAKINIVYVTTSNAWTFLITSDRLANLKQYNLNPIDDVSLLLILFQDVATTTKYIDLTKAQKTLLYNLSQVKSYQSTIDDQIAKAKKSKTTPLPQKTKTSTSDVWNFLQTNDRLQKLQTNNTSKTKKFDLSIFAKSKPKTKYKDLTLKQNEALHTLSQLANYQNEIKKILNEPITTKTEDSDNLLWLWITLPLFLFLFFVFIGKKNYQSPNQKNQKNKVSSF